MTRAVAVSRSCDKVRVAEGEPLAVGAKKNQIFDPAKLILLVFVPAPTCTVLSNRSSECPGERTKIEPKSQMPKKPAAEGGGEKIEVLTRP